MNAHKPSFFAELKRRNVYKVGAMYAVSGWLLVQVVTQVLPVFDVSALAQRIIVLAIVAGFPVALVLSWIYELTPQGIVRTGEVVPDASITRATGQKLNHAIIAVLAVAVLVLLADKLLLHRAAPPAAGDRAVAAANDKSIAVLPFDNLSDDKANSYFAEGIQDEILTRLAKIGALKVISRTSTQQYAARPGSLSDIGRQLGVANILEGSVQKAGDSVHINVQLIRAATDEHLWAESYNRKLDDIFGVEGEVAQTIAERMKAALTGAEAQQISAKLTDNPDAYDAYLRGLAFGNRADALGPNTLNAIAAFSEAVRLDPGFATAWAWLSREHAFAYWLSDPSAAHKEAARAALDTARKLAPDSDETLSAQGFYRYWLERDYNGARSIFEQLRQRLPNDDRAVYALAAINRRQGRWPESLALFQQAIPLNPRDMLLQVDAAATAVSMRDVATAQRLIDQGLDVAPDDAGELATLTTLLQLQGRIDEAQKVLDRIHIVEGDDNSVFTYSANAILGRRYGPAIELLKSQLAKPEALGTSLGAYQMLLGELQRHAGQTDAAQQSYQQARSTLRAALAAEPDNANLLQTLAQAEAGLGNQAETLASIRRAIELLPTSRDALVGPAYEETLARLQARFGDKDAAIAGVQRLLGLSYSFPPLSVAVLRLDPDFDGLRDDPRFQKLLAGG